MSRFTSRDAIQIRLSLSHARPWGHISNLPPRRDTGIVFSLNQCDNSRPETAMSPIVVNCVRDKPRVTGSRMRTSIPAYAQRNSRKSDATSTVTYFARILEFHDNKSARRKIPLREKWNKVDVIHEKKILRRLNTFKQCGVTKNAFAKLRCSFFEIIYKYDIMIRFNYK